MTNRVKTSVFKIKQNTQNEGLMKKLLNSLPQQVYESIAYSLSYTLLLAFVLLLLCVFMGGFWLIIAFFQPALAIFLSIIWMLIVIFVVLGLLHYFGLIY